MNTVLIASIDDWDTGVEIPYMFSKADYEVDIFCKKGSWLQSNSFHNNYIEANNSNENFISGLLEIIQKKKYDFIILTEDPLLKYLNDRIVDPNLFVKILPLIKIENRKILSSKNGFSEFCIENNLLTPKYHSYNSKEDYFKIIEELNFPLIKKYEFSWGGMDMNIIQNKDELQKTLEYQEENKNIMFQEYIDGEEIGIDAFFYKGQLITYFCAKVITYSTNKFSFSTRRLYFNNLDLKAYLTELGEKSGANGFASISYIQENTTGKYFLIEMDLRTNSWMAYSQYLSDNNFISAIRNINSKNKFQDANAILFNKEIEIALFYKDIHRLIFKKDIRGIFKWILNQKRYWRFLPFYDLILSKRIFYQLWAETFHFKWKEWTGKYK